MSLSFICERASDSRMYWSGRLCCKPVCNQVFSERKTSPLGDTMGLNAIATLGSAPCVFYQISSPLSFRLFTYQMIILCTVIYLLTISIREKQKRNTVLNQRPGRNNNCLDEQWATTGWARWTRACIYLPAGASCELWVLHPGFELHWTVFLGVIHGSLIVSREENYADMKYFKEFSDL